MKGGKVQYFSEKSAFAGKKNQCKEHFKSSSKGFSSGHNELILGCDETIWGADSVEKDLPAISGE